MDEKLKKKLLDGNQRFIQNDSVISLRKETSDHGQHPFAAVLCCSDSRVIPEQIFSCSIGDLFVIRVAGNVACEEVLGSLEYAISHLHVSLVIVLGHTHCGAIEAALHGHQDGFVATLTKPIMKAIGSQRDAQKASESNAIAQAGVISSSLASLTFDVVAAMYDIQTGKVTFLEKQSD